MAAAVAAAPFAVIEIGAAINFRREQSRRLSLGDELYTESEGQGDPVVFLAGLQGSTRFWGDTFDALAVERQLIFVDALGFGQSPWPARAPTLDDHLEALHRTLAGKGATRRVTLVGHSFGTLLAAHYAARYPSEVDRLILLGAPVFAGEEDARRRLHEISHIAALFTLNRLLAREACMFMGATRPVLRAWLPAFTRKLAPPVAQDAVLHCWPAIDGAIRNVLLTQPIATPLESFRGQVTFFHGDRDGVTPMARVRELAARTGAQLIDVPCDHLGYLLAAGERIGGAIGARISPPGGA